ncbi:MAG: hypothetical protein U5Q16_09810 [Gammaproteobacteria bacterium]|nr:hypothetical protein [Gammaproteobacteria bacterium]
MFQATVLGTRLDDIATASVHCRPEAAAGLGEAVAAQLGQSAAGEAALSGELARRCGQTAGAGARRCRTAAGRLRNGLAAPPPLIVQAAATSRRALAARGREVSLCLNVPECNAMGAQLLGGGLGLGEVLAQLERGEADTLIVLENESMPPGGR